jgi:hypothetical protein
MALWSWGKKKEENHRLEGPSRIILTRRMQFHEIQELVKECGGCVFDKKNVAHFKKDPNTSFYELTRTSDGG